MACLDILDISAGASIQDFGRRGWQRYGVTAGGAMDRFALAEGQAILGNGPDAAALEFAVRGGRFRAVDSLAISTSGAEMDLKVNDVSRRWRSCLLLRSGDILEIGYARRGFYGYLHIPGGVEAPKILGSRSYLLMAGIGRDLASGDRLRGVSDRIPGSLRSLSPNAYLERRAIRVVLAAQSRMFPDRMRRDFKNSEFEILPARNRQGIRLAATRGPFCLDDGLRVPSAAISSGDIQISGDGTPIILMADSQPTGGFPRIACVISADLDAVAQMPIGEKFRIQIISREEAVSELGRMRREIDNLRSLAEASETESAGECALLRHSLISGAIRGDEYELD